MRAADLLLLIQAAGAVAPVPSVTPSRPDYSTATSLAPPPSAAGPSANPTVPPDGSLAAPVPPLAVEPAYLRRPSPDCADFKPAEGAGWSALANVQFPGPRGSVQVPAGQTITPGDYSLGMDLGSILQRDCPRTPRPPAP